MSPKLLASLAAAPLAVCLCAHAQSRDTELAMNAPFAPRATHLDAGLLRVKERAPDKAEWPIIHGPSYFPQWNDDSVPRDGEHAPLHSDRFHFH
jgi:hypothetical protein